MAKAKRLWDLYRFPGFYPEHTVTGIFGDPGARVIKLVRRGKKQPAESVGLSNALSTIANPAESGICPVATCGSTWIWKSAGFSAAGVGK